MCNFSTSFNTDWNNYLRISFYDSNCRKKFNKTRVSDYCKIVKPSNYLMLQKQENVTISRTKEAYKTLLFHTNTGSTIPKEFSVYFVRRKLTRPLIAKCGHGLTRSSTIPPRHARWRCQFVLPKRFGAQRGIRIRSYIVYIM